MENTNKRRRTTCPHCEKSQDSKSKSSPSKWLAIHWKCWCPYRVSAEVFWEDLCSSDEECNPPADSLPVSADRPQATNTHANTTVSESELREVLSDHDDLADLQSGAEYADHDVAQTDYLPQQRSQPSAAIMVCQFVLENRLTTRQTKSLLGLIHTLISDEVLVSTQELPRTPSQYLWHHR